MSNYCAGVCLVVYMANTTRSPGSVTQTTTHATGISSNEVADPAKGFFARWVFFPKLIESCGTLSRREVESVNPPCGTSVCPPPTQQCSGDIENLKDICTLSPVLDDQGEPELYWTIRKFLPLFSPNALTVIFSSGGCLV